MAIDPMTLMTIINAGAGIGKSLFGKDSEGTPGATGGVNIMDELLKGGIGTGFGLLESIFSGMGKSAEDKRKMEMWQQQMGERREGLESIKPQQDYYGIEKNLPQFDPMMLKAIMGMFSERTGDGFSRYGISPDMLAGLGQGAGQRVPQGGVSNQSRPFQQGGTRIANKYGLAL